MTDTERGALDEAIDRAARKIEQEVIAWRHHVHANPELSNREVKTAAFIHDKLAAFGLDDIHAGVGGHGVVGVLRGGLPGDRVMALRADIDALPVKEDSGVDFASTVVDHDYPGGPFPVAHACGHDCHVAMLLGAAQVLSGLRDKLPGSLVFVFQPAEEGPPIDEEGGARAMLKHGILDELKPTMIFGMHVVPRPKGYIGYRTGNEYSASRLLKIDIQGKQGHGSQPWESTDPMPIAADIISAMGQIYRQVPSFEPITVSIGHLHDVGRFNIIGGHLTLWGTVRALNESVIDSVCDLVARTVENIARAYGGSATAEFLQPVPPVCNTPQWMEAALPTLRRAVGADKVVEIPPTMGYDDMSEFVNKFGGLYVTLGVQDVEVIDGKVVPIAGGRGKHVNHNPGFYADDGTLVEGVRILSYVACDHLNGVIDPTR